MIVLEVFVLAKGNIRPHIALQQRKAVTVLICEEISHHSPAVTITVATPDSRNALKLKKMVVRSRTTRARKNLNGVTVKGPIRLVIYLLSELGFDPHSIPQFRDLY